MENINLIEKFKVLFNLIKSTKEAKFVIPVVLFIAVTLVLGNFKKKNILVYILSYLIIIGSLVGLYHTEFLRMLDYLVQFTTDSLLFPSLGIYVVMLLLSNIVVITSILSKKISLLIKNINIVFFSIIELITFFIINLIINSDVDIYNVLTVYSNDKLLVLIELSMAIFAIWILLINIINIIHKLTNKLNNRNIIEEVNNNEIVVENTIEEDKILNISSNEIKVNYINNKLEFVEDTVCEVTNVIELEEPEQFIEFVPIKKKRLEIDF